MKIIHGPMNIGGMAGVLASAQRKLGYQARSKCLNLKNLNFKTDEYFTRMCLSSEGTIEQKVRDYFGVLYNYDIFQFYFGFSFFRENLQDIPLLKKIGKKIFFYFCGCDVRDSKKTIEKYQYNACKECWPMFCNPNRNRAVEYALKYADAVFVSTPDLLEFVPNASLLLQPIDLEIMRSFCKQSPYLKDKQTFVIAHAPTSTSIKGTKYINTAVAELKDQGYCVELILIQNKTQQETLEICQTADLVIDQLLIGAYGQVSVEMMALGKPVICYLREDLISLYPEPPPIINANPDNILSVLKSILDNREALINIGEKGKEYVARYHDHLLIAQKMIDFYNN
jgi:hypothetical protein